MKVSTPRTGCFTNFCIFNCAHPHHNPNPMEIIDKLQHQLPLTRPDTQPSVYSPTLFRHISLENV